MQVEQALTNANLSIENVKCITSDGAADICGENNGVITRLAQSSPTKIGIPCDLHALQLSFKNSILVAFGPNISIGSMHPVQLVFLAINTISLDQERFRHFVTERGLSDKLLVAQKLPTLNRWGTVVKGMSFVVKHKYVTF